MFKERLFVCVFITAPGFAQQKPAYVDSKICNTCHSEVYRTYRNTGMARSFYRPGSEPTTGEPFYHKPTRAYYSMQQREGIYFQRRWQPDRDGKQAYLQEWQIDFVMGSGNHVRTYLHRGENGTLEELPLAWYSENNGFWAMNPGYDTDRFITPRKIAYECIFCHNAYPKIPAGHDRQNSVPVYTYPLPEGIDCQRCHGPGSRHIQLAQSKATADDLRKSILNPKRLTGDRQMEVCMQCHLQTTSLRLPSAIRRFDRGPFSYRAGEPLAGFVLFFDRASEPQPKFEIVSSVVRLRKSRCFLGSKGALTCLTCHDPHNIPRGEQASMHYNAACRSCHNTLSDKHTTASNCIPCHMPKRRTDDVVHAVMTDHLIQRQPPPSLLAEIPETHETEATAYHGEVVPYYPASIDSLYLAVAQVQHDSNLNKGIDLLSSAIDKQKPARADFYFELGEAWRHQGNPSKAIAAYEQASQRDPTSAWILRRLADALLSTGQRSRAAAILTRAVEAAPDDARGWYALGELRAESGQKADAIAAFKKSVQLDSDLPDAYNSLGSTLAESGNVEDAEKAFRSALRIQPDLADAQANLGILLASKNELLEASEHFERALSSQPQNTTARCNFAITLARLNHPEEAEHQLRLAIETNPSLPEPHDLLGTILKNEGHSEAALQEYREAIRVRPGFNRGYLDLGIAQAETGDLAGATQNLRKAAAGNDPAIRQKAQQILKQLSQ
ncbi:MAG TPA: tetratricopeptide repeat protein [Bryobacteraceae bacterium]|jgi:predicted CXXCH cytochrome family protein|nr:tetratricopeptide repeat protein [Bryobacteraceae bacterium]